MGSPGALRCGVGALAAWVLAAAVLPAQEFRVDNWVHDARSGQVLQYTVTLAQGGRVYDLVPHTGQAELFDPAAGHLVLSCPVQSGPHRPGVYTVVPLVELDRLVLQLQGKMAQASDPRLRRLARPRPQWVSHGPAWWLRTQWFEYRVDPVQAPSRAILRQYHEFLQWSTRLAVLNNPVMLLRLELNRRLLERGELPGEITLLVYQPGILGLKHPEAALRSRHRYRWQLASEDQRLIQRLLRRRSRFHRVDWKTYRGLVEQLP